MRRSTRIDGSAGGEPLSCGNQSTYNRVANAGNLHRLSPFQMPFGILHNLTGKSSLTFSIEKCHFITDICFSPDDGDYYLYLNCTRKTSESAPSVSDSTHSTFYPHVIENGVTVQYIYFAYLPELPANYTVYIDQDAIKVVQ